MNILLGILFILHGLVHLLYAGQSWRFFELRPGMTWPDQAWALAKFISALTIRWLAGITLVLATLGFGSAGLGIILEQEWWRLVAGGAALYSTLIFLLFWDGKFKSLDDQGGIGVLINLAALLFGFFFKEML